MLYPMLTFYSCQHVILDVNMLQMSTYSQWTVAMIGEKTEWSATPNHSKIDWLGVPDLSETERLGAADH